MREGPLSLKESLRHKTPSVGSWLSLGHTEVAEIMTQCGFDWLVIDMEHSSTTSYQALQLIRVIELSECLPLVRVSENHPTLIKQAMDAGAHGVVVPMVNTREEAAQAVSAVKYPPEGTRGVGLWRAHDYGMSFDEYCEWLQEYSVVIVQIEHIEAVSNLEAIVSVEGVDGFIVGPYDLAASLGLPGEFSHPRVAEAMEVIEETARHGPKAAGIHIVRPDHELLFEKLEAGYTFLAFGVDMIFLWEAAKSALQVVRERIPPPTQESPSS